VSIAISLTLVMLQASHAESASLTAERCESELDSIVALLTAETARNMALESAAGSLAAAVDHASLDRHLAQLEDRCPSLPQLAHNRGVLAARTNRWTEAIAHFQRSLQQDGRAADTYRTLQQIFEHRAAEAYARALDTPVSVPAPTLHWQDSTDLNAHEDAGGTPAHALQTIPTLEYELYAWWQALQNAVGLEEHYVDGFPPEAIHLSREHFANRFWDDMQREIAFTAQDAVAVISDAFHNRTLLLLRLVGTRWKIYQETRL
jgi:hypothetical protein